MAAAAALAGCERARDLWEGAEKLRGDSPEIQVGGEIAGELDSLVYRHAGGVIFRRDLPFPTQLQVRMQVHTDYSNVMVSDVSALGQQTYRLNRIDKSEMLFAKSPGSFGLKVGQVESQTHAETESGITPELAAASGENADKRELEFRLTQSGWKVRQGANSSDFKAIVWADALQPHIPVLMVEAGIQPRTQWFSASRVWKEGDQLMLTGTSLQIIEPNKGSGRVTLTFEGVEAVEGHPCGVFSLNGNLKILKQTQLDGSRRDLSVTIRSGKIWASLLHPVLLREEYETVQTTKVFSGSSSKDPHTRQQGAIKVQKSRHWLGIES